MIAIGPVVIHTGFWRKEILKQQHLRNKE